MTEQLDDFDRLFLRGGRIWLVKTFQEQLLSALIDDLKAHESLGIPDNVCADINESLGDAIEVLKGIEDGNFLLMPFYQAVKGFQKLYQKWNAAKTQADRIKLLAQLKGKKRTLIGFLYKEVKGLENGDEKKRERKMELVRQLDSLRISNLNTVFDRLANNHPKTFPSIQNTLLKFRRKRWVDNL